MCLNVRRFPPPSSRIDQLRYTCIRSLCNRLIVTAIEKKDTSPPPYSMPLLSVQQNSDGDDDEENDVWPLSEVKRGIEGC